MTHTQYGLLFISLLVVATFGQNEDGMSPFISTTALKLAPPWLDWTVTDDNVMGGVSSGTVEERSDGSLAFQGAVSFDQNGGFSNVDSHGRGSVDVPVALNLSRFDKDGGIRVSFHGDDVFAAAEGPRAVNLNVYETNSRMSFGGLSPSSTSSSFVVYPSSVVQSWFLPFSTFTGSSFSSPDEVRGLPLANLTDKLGMQVRSFGRGAESSRDPRRCVVLTHIYLFISTALSGTSQKRCICCNGERSNRHCE